ncbi:hypothetical protein GCM10010274_63320 [Streptomyces lavendofoliae]|uniref:Uncharacterized protein n=2 Tax=Streptomyces lavendofoliae TaxID=67314 RepID=A0A918I430_9ACTN|nr:hypothetical protein GCM10010274_63320 [Streptomyces lavendofoliae]
MDKASEWGAAVGESQVTESFPEPAPDGEDWRERLRRYAASRIIRPGLARPPYDTAIVLGCVSLACGCAAVLLAGSDVLGTEALGTSGRQLSRAAIVAILLVLATAVWALGIAAITARRAPRLWLAALAMSSAGVAASVHTAALQIARALSHLLTANPSVDFGIITVPLWALVAASVSILAAAAVLFIPLRHLAAHPKAYGLLVSAPVWSALLIWAGLSHVGNQLPSGLSLSAAATERLSAPPATASLYFLSGLLLLGLLGGLRVLALLAAAEVADANVTVAQRSARWRPLGATAVVVGLVVAKVVFLGLGFAGVFGDDGTGETWDRGFWGQWVLSVLLVTLACLGYLAARARPLRAGHFGPISTLLVVGFGLPGLVLMALVYFHAATGALLPGPWQGRLSDHVMNAVVVLAHFTPLGTVVVTGVAGLVMLARRGRTDGAVLAVAAFAVGLPVAVQIALIDGTPITRSLLSLPILDAVVTAALLVALVTAALRPHRALPAQDLLVILVMSSLLSFAVDAFVPEGIQAWLFAVILLAPVVWRFAVDTREEQQRPIHRTVLSLTGWSMVLAVSSLALAHGFGHENWGTEDRLTWRLVAIPLAFVLLCRRSLPAREPARGWRAGPTPGDRPPESRYVYAAGALVAILLVSAASLGLAKSLEVPRVKRGQYLVSTTLPDNWFPAQCPSEGDAEMVLLVLENEQAAIVAGHGSRDGLESAGRNCPDVDQIAKDVLKNPNCTGVVTAGARPIEAGGMPGAEFHANNGVIRCAHWKADGIERFVVAIDEKPGLQGMRPALTSAIEGITFSSR